MRNISEQVLYTDVMQGSATIVCQIYEKCRVWQVPFDIRDVDLDNYIVDKIANKVRHTLRDDYFWTKKNEG